jgi:hypothetical protein
MTVEPDENRVGTLRALKSAIEKRPLNEMYATIETT